MRAILTYHSIDDSGSPISVDAAAFRRHVDFLAAGRVKVVPLAELTALPDATDALAITFDDAFESLHRIAWPLLHERGLAATVFVPTSRVGRDNAWGERAERGIPVLPLCDWDQLGGMAGEGLDVGSHTVTHARLDGMDYGLVRDELALSSQALEEHLGRRPLHFAYPYGTFDSQAEQLAAEHYQRAVTTELRVLGAGEPPHRLPRLDAFYYRSNRTLEAYATKPFQRHLWLRAMARRARGLVGGGVRDQG